MILKMLMTIKIPRIHHSSFRNNFGTFLIKIGYELWIETYNDTNNFVKFWQGNQKSFKQSSTTKMEMFVLHYLFINIQWEH